MENPVELSVVIPAYQAEKTIGRAINSVRALEGIALEIIVVDDGSKDATPNIVAAISAADARVRLIAQSNAGRSAARNVGIHAAHGKWVMFIDSDDYLYPNVSEPLKASIGNADTALYIFAAHQNNGFDAYGRPWEGEYCNPLAITSSASELFDYMLGMPRFDEPFGSGAYQLDSVWARLYLREKLTGINIKSELGEWGPFPVSVRLSEDRLLNIAYLSTCDGERVKFRPETIYCWDTGYSQTCEVVRADEPADMLRYWNYCQDLCEAGSITGLQARYLLTTELISKFARAVRADNLPQKVFASKWKELLAEDAIRALKVSMVAGNAVLRKWTIGAVLIKARNIPAAFSVCSLLYRAIHR